MALLFFMNIYNTLGKGKMNTVLARSFLIVFLLITVSQAKAETVFSPSSCEFSVEFSVPYKTGTSMSAGGNKTIKAKATPRKGISLGAECWDAIHNLDIVDFADNLRKGMIEKGFSVTGLNIDKNSSVPSVMLTGTVTAQKKLVHIKMISYFGSNSRMDLFIVEEELASSEGLNFRNSIRKK
jgi:hypothetical protein